MLRARLTMVPVCDILDPAKGCFWSMVPPQAAGPPRAPGLAAAGEAGQGAAERRRAGGAVAISHELVGLPARPGSAARLSSCLSDRCSPAEATVAQEAALADVLRPCEPEAAEGLVEGLYVCDIRARLRDMS